MMGVLGALGIASSVSAMVPAINRAVSYETNKLFPNLIPDPMIAIELLRRKRIDVTFFRNIMAAHGYTNDVSKLLFSATQRLIEVSDLVKLKFRNALTKTKYLERMAALGISNLDAVDILTSNLSLMSPADIAVLRRRGKLSLEDFNKYMGWVGVSSDIATNYLNAVSMELSVDEIIALYRREKLTKDQFESNLSHLGYDSEQATELLFAREMLMNPTDLVILKWREKIDNEQYLSDMKSLGFSRSNSVKFEQRMMFYPSAQDLITWTAKEVFEPDAIEKYGLLDEFELLRTEDFSKAGLTETQVKNYWIAHWEHPAFNAIREMYFRSKDSDGKPKLDYDDIYEWFRLVEIPPYWRDKFIDIMHEPFTRVDVRRMHSLKILNNEQVVEAYMELGYDRWKAEKLLEFTISYNLGSERELTRTMLEKAYEYGEINRELFLEFLVEMRYDEHEAELIVTLFELKLGKEEFDTIIDTILLRFKNGLIDQETAIIELDKLGVKGSHRDNLVAKMLREKQATFKLPSKDDILTWFVFNEIEKSEAEIYLDRLGYAKIDIDRYLNLAGKEL